MTAPTTGLADGLCLAEGVLSEGERRNNEKTYQVGGVFSTHWRAMAEQKRRFCSYLVPLVLLFLFLLCCSRWYHKCDAPHHHHSGPTTDPLLRPTPHPHLHLAPCGPISRRAPAPAPSALHQRSMARSWCYRALAIGRASSSISSSVGSNTNSDGPCGGK